MPLPFRIHVYTYDVDVYEYERSGTCCCATTDFAHGLLASFQTMRWKFFPQLKLSNANSQCWKTRARHLRAVSQL